MVTRLEIALRPELDDPRGVEVAREVRDFLDIELDRVRTREVYRIDGALSAEEHPVFQGRAPTIATG